MFSRLDILERDAYTCGRGFLVDVARFVQKTSLDEVLEKERERERLGNSGILSFGTVARISVYKSEK